MVKVFTLKSRSREIRYKGCFESAADCLEAAMADGVDMRALKLSGLNLARANLDGGAFEGTDFSGCNLSGANMSECDLRSCVFSHAALMDVCLCDSNLTKAGFYEASFSASDITGTRLEECLFSCPSAFTLKFADAAHFKDCIFYAEGQHCPMFRPPLVVGGLSLPLVAMDDHLMIGRTVRTLGEWACAARFGERDGREQAFFSAHRTLIAELLRVNAAADDAADLSVRIF